MNSAIALLVTLRSPPFPGRARAILQHLAIGAAGALAYARRDELLAWAAFLAWLLLALLPALVARWLQRLVLQRRYALARPLGALIGLLAPRAFPREIRQLIDAYVHLHAGRVDECRVLLRELAAGRSPARSAAARALCVLEGTWGARLAELERDRAEQLARGIVDVDALTELASARAESGDLSGALELRAQLRTLPTPPRTPVERALEQLESFAYGGRPRGVAALCDGALAALPALERRLWLATAALRRGERALARAELLALQPLVDPLRRRIVERRLAESESATPAIDEATQAELEALEAQAIEEQELFQALASRPLRAPVTLALLGALVAVFVWEELRGGSTSLEVLYEMGALYAPAVAEGEYWRLGAALFLHYGALHLALNALALLAWGPPLERNLGRLRFALLYFGAGLLSMISVCAAARWQGGPSGILVGASGAILGLLGAALADLVARRRRRSSPWLERNLRFLLLLLGLQVAFDLLVPQVSQLGHLAGAAAGFALGLLLRRERESAPSTHA
ncbi:MAG: rhomboid family intramembrane serine protease [Planctomycetes bacterium]|nr:rhomboid family intramembrane serine protease [Planctomycetota bacterium]